MRKLLFLFFAFCCIVACSEKSASYKLVLINEDGTENIRLIDAANDSAACERTLSILDSIEPKSAYLLRANGDTIDIRPYLLKQSFGNMQNEIDSVTSELDSLFSNISNI